MDSFFAEFYKALIYAVAAIMSLTLFVNHTYKSDDMKELINDNFQSSTATYQGDAVRNVTVSLKNYASTGDIVKIPFKSNESQKYVFKVLSARGTEASLLLLGFENHSGDINSSPKKFSVGTNVYRGSAIYDLVNGFGEDMHDDYGDAIIAKPVIQHFYTSNIDDGGTFAISLEDGQHYLMPDEEISTDVFYARLPDFKDLTEYYRKTTLSSAEVSKVFFDGIEAHDIWLSSAAGSNAAEVYVITASGSASTKETNEEAYIHPVVSIDLSQIPNFEVIYED